MTTFQLITSVSCLATFVYKPLIYHLIWVLCKEDNSNSNIDMLQNCTVLNSGNTPSIVKLYWEIEFLSGAQALNTTTVGSRLTAGLCSRIFGCKSNSPKMSTI